MNEPAFNTLRFEGPRDGVALVTLQRPERLNPISPEMFDELHALCDAVKRDRDIRVLVLTGAGRGFCSGADLSTIAAIADVSLPSFMEFQEHAAAAIVRLKSLSKPVIAAVNGPAAGGGLALALVADIRVAAPEARFNVAPVRIGLSGCDVGLSWLLPRIVGFGHASELMLTGRLIDAHAAARIGLVNHVVPAEELIPKAYALAGEIARNSPFGVRLTKQGLQLNVDAPSLQAAVAVENRNQALAACTEDMSEALSAFRERRQPAFAGR